MTTTEATRPSFEEQAGAVYAYLSQAEWWKPNGRPAIRIAEMDKEWRYNASRWLERRAAGFATLYNWGEIRAWSAPTLREVVEIGGEQMQVGRPFSHLDLMGDHAMDAWEDVQDFRDREPAAWIRTTALYRALVADLPTQRRKLARLADRAQHWADCPGRRGEASRCRCEEIRAAQAKSPAPEWTLS